MKCKCCGKDGHHFHQFYDGGYVCEDCIGKYFVCPDCGRVFDKDDYAHGDTGTGFCIECASKH